MNKEELIPYAYCLAAAFIISIICSIISTRKHKKALQKAASKIGLSYEGNGTEAANDLLDSFSGFSSISVRHFLEGKQRGKGVVIGEYVDRNNGSQKNRRYRDRFSIVAFHSDSLSIPNFILQPESFSFRLFEGIIAKKTSLKDINFSSHPDFSDNYILTGPNESAIREYFTPKLLKYFEANPGLCIHASQNALLFYRREYLVRPEDLKKFLSHGLEILHVFEQAPEKVPLS